MYILVNYSIYILYKVYQIYEPGLTQLTIIKLVQLAPADRLLIFISSKYSNSIIDSILLQWYYVLE